MTKTIFIYALKCPITGEPRYVGQTPDPERRLAAHLRCKKEYHCARWIRSLRSRNLVPVMEILDQASSTEADFWEIEYIRLYRALYPGLTNISSGGRGFGEGFSGHAHTPESRAKISAASRGKKRAPFSAAHLANMRLAGLKRPPATLETRKKNSDKQRKRAPATPETRAKISASLKGKKHTPEHRAKNSAAQMGKKRGADTFATRENKRIAALARELRKKQARA